MIRVVLMVGLVFAAVMGCSPSANQAPASPEQSRESVLHELANLLRTAAGTQAKIPAKVSELAPFSAGGPLAYDAVQKGDIIVLWGASLPGEGDAASAPEAIIAHEKVAPTEGGYVLLQNGQVKKVTAQEFDSLAKAK